MKHIFAIIIAVLFYTNLFSQNKTSSQIPPNAVPPPVKDAFTAKFPSNPKVIWRNEKPTEFSAEVSTEFGNMWTVFDPIGTVICTKNAIKENELPPEVITTLNTFASYKITDPKRVNHSQHSICFEVILERADEKQLLLLNPMGVVIIKEEKTK